jgi:hypothetical protein
MAERLSGRRRDDPTIHRETDSYVVVLGLFPARHRTVVVERGIAMSEKTPPTPEELGAALDEAIDALALMASDELPDDRAKIVGAASLLTQHRDAMCAGPGMEQKFPVMADGVRWDGVTMPWIPELGRYAVRRAWYVALKDLDPHSVWVAYSQNDTHMDECYSTREAALAALPTAPDTT